MRQRSFSVQEERCDRGVSLGAQRHRHHDKAGFPSPGLIYNVFFWERGEKGRGRAVGFLAIFISRRVCRSHPFVLEVQEGGWRLLLRTTMTSLNANACIFY